MCISYQLLCNMVSKCSDLKQHFVVAHDSVGWVGGSAHLKASHSGAAFIWWLDWRQRAWDTSLQLLGTWYVLSARPSFPFSCLERVHLLIAEAFQGGRSRCCKISWGLHCDVHTMSLLPNSIASWKDQLSFKGWEKRSHLLGLPWQASG